MEKISLQASYTLWLSRSQEKFSRWTLVEKPRPAETATPTQQPSPPVAASSKHMTRPTPRPPADIRVTPRASGRERSAIDGMQEKRSPRGLVNLDNTCFINSIAQRILANVSLIALTSASIENALTKLKSFCGQITRPTELVKAISLQSPSLTSGQQQDAAEALEAMLMSRSGPCIGETADVISCLTCGDKSMSTRSLAPPIIQVPITAPSLELCLNNLLTPQPLKGRRCSQCWAVSSVLSTQILATPCSMALHLLRFQHGSQVEKNTSSVKLTPAARLDGVTWHLSGIVNHFGTLNQGHYTAYVRQNQRWFLCDDSSVAEVSAEAALSLSVMSAYVIFLSKS